MKPAKTTRAGYRNLEDALAGLERGDFRRDHLTAFQISKKWTQALWAKRHNVDHSTASRCLDRLLQLGLIWRGSRVRVEGTLGAIHIYYLSSLGGRVLQRITSNTSVVGIRAASGAKDAHDLAILSLVLAGKGLLGYEDISLQTRLDIPIEWRTWRWAMSYQRAMLDWQEQQGRALGPNEIELERPTPPNELKGTHFGARSGKSFEDWLADFRPSLISFMPDISWPLQLDDDILDLMCIEVETTTDYKHILQKYRQLIKIIKTVQTYVRLWVLVVFPSQAILDRGRRWHEMAFWRAGGQPSFYSKVPRLVVYLTTLPAALKTLEQGYILDVWQEGSMLEPKPIERMQWTFKKSWRR